MMSFRKFIRIISCEYLFRGILKYFDFLCYTWSCN